MEIQKLNVSPKHSRWTHSSPQYLTSWPFWKQRVQVQCHQCFWLPSRREAGVSFALGDTLPCHWLTNFVGRLLHQHPALPGVDTWPSVGEQETCPLATTKLPVTATWNFWKRRPGGTWTSLMRMAWRPHSWPPTTGTWKPWRSSAAEGECSLERPFRRVWQTRSKSREFSETTLPSF